MDNLLSPREIAQALGVSESSVKRWVDGGELASLRTAGGHRRIARSEALRFARAKSMQPARPELLSLVGVRIAVSALSDEERSEAFHLALVEGDGPRALGLLTSAFVGGASIASICDGPIRIALERIGETWKHDEKGILVEHRAMDLCLQALGVLRALLPVPADDAPVAIGSAGPQDPYLLPSSICAVVLGELGFRAVNLGPCTPVSTKLAAVEVYRPLLVWHAASVGGEELSVLVNGLRQSPHGADVRVVAGGRAIAAAKASSSVVSLTTMKELQAFARGLLPARAASGLR